MKSKITIVILIFLIIISSSVLFISKSQTDESQSKIDLMFQRQFSMLISQLNIESDELSETGYQEHKTQILQKTFFLLNTMTWTSFSDEEGLVTVIMAIEEAVISNSYAYDLHEPLEIIHRDLETGVNKEDVESVLKVLHNQ